MMSILRRISPAVVIVIDHQLRHTTVDTDILSRDESGLVGTQKQHHVRNIHRIPDPSCRLLQGIRPFLHRISRIDPSRRNRVHPDLAGKARSQCVLELLIAARINSLHQPECSSCSYTCTPEHLPCLCFTSSPYRNLPEAPSGERMGSGTWKR